MTNVNINTSPLVVHPSPVHRSGTLLHGKADPIEQLFAGLSLGTGSALGLHRLVGVASIGGSFAVALAVSVAVVGLGAPHWVLVGLVPAGVLFLAGAALLLHKAPRPDLEALILGLAQRHEGEVSVAALALESGRPLVECRQALDVMARNGWAHLDLDDSTGKLVYRILDVGVSAKASSRRS